MLGGIGIGELVLILVIALIVVGPGKLPEVGKALGKALGSFKKALSDTEELMGDKDQDKHDE